MKTGLLMIRQVRTQLYSTQLFGRADGFFLDRVPIQALDLTGNMLNSLVGVNNAIVLLQRAVYYELSSSAR